MLPVNWNPGVPEIRSFSRIWLPLFVLLAGAMVWRRAGSLEGAVAVWVIGGVVSLACVVSRETARRVFVGLQVVAYPIGFVVSFVGLAALFYGVITPIAWGMRLAGRDALRLRQRGDRSHWASHQQVDDPERAFRQF